MLCDTLQKGQRTFDKRMSSSRRLTELAAIQKACTPPLVPLLAIANSQGPPIAEDILSHVACVRDGPIHLRGKEFCNPHVDGHGAFLQATLLAFQPYSGSPRHFQTCSLA